MINIINDKERRNCKVTSRSYKTCFPLDRHNLINQGVWGKANKVDANYYEHIATRPIRKGKI